MLAIAMWPQRSRSWSTTPSRPAQLTCRLTSLVIRARSSRVQISITDDGQGMSLKELQLALVFGGSSRFGSRDSFGRFGMGLPSASLSLARDVEVRSWRGASMRTVRLSLDDRDGLSRRGVRTRRLSLGGHANPKRNHRAASIVRPTRLRASGLVEPLDYGRTRADIPTPTRIGPPSLRKR